jgi:hypothetical protein
MLQNMSLSRRRAIHLSLDFLEGRSLLNAALPSMEHGRRPAAEVFDAKFKSTIVPNLPSTPDAKLTTVPASGDVNPYGVALVPAGFPKGGMLKSGQILVSNFNDSMNTQGTGTTIVAITPGQNPSTAPVFFTSQSTGLTLALGVLKSGFVIVGNVPTTDGTFGTIGQGSLQIIDRSGHVVQTLSDPKLLDGPWASTLNDHGNTAQLFVSNVLSGTVTRINLKVVHHRGSTSVDVTGMTQIASGYTVQPNGAAVVVGPGGLAYNAKSDTLYVASTGDNEIFAVADASRTHSDNGMGSLIYQDPAHLFGPIGLVLAPNGDLLATNDDAVNTSHEMPSQTSALTEFTPTGTFVGQISLDSGAGGAFGLVVYTHGRSLTVASVDDVTNTLDFRTITNSSAGTSAPGY